MPNTINVFEERRGRLVAALRLKRPIYVALVSSDKAYGGPEEGGWYFDTQQVLEQTPVESFSGAMMHIVSLQDRYSNEGRYRPDSVLCNGWYQILVCTEPVMDEPQSRPRYE